MRVIAEKFFKISFESKTHVPTRNMIFEPNIGYVVIGDLGLEISTSRMSGLKIYDLGEIWFNETGYPFTFASFNYCLLYTSPSPRDAHESRMPSSA